jgi:hypothetical protein
VIEALETATNIYLASLAIAVISGVFPLVNSELYWSA